MDVHKYFWILAVGITGIVLAEYYFSKKRRLGNFAFGESVSNISNGIADRLFQVILIPLYYDIFEHIHTHWALFRIQVNGWTVALLFVAIDFLWYWYHRLSHEINVLWGAHVVHHQSSIYNFTVALKITPFQAVIRYTVWAALPLAGFSPELTFLLIGVNAVHQFLIHTELIGRLGWLEQVLVTPSHHRVHHASNPAYLDKNYGGFFIIWDKLFGTFRREAEPVRYGLTEPLPSRGFIYGYFHYWARLWRTARRLRSWKLFLGRPARMPEEDTKTMTDRSLKKLPWKVRLYICSMMTLCAGMLIFLSVYHDRLSLRDICCLYAFILLALTATGALLGGEGRPFFITWLQLSVLSIGIVLRSEAPFSPEPFSCWELGMLAAAFAVVTAGIFITREAG